MYAQLQEDSIGEPQRPLRRRGRKLAEDLEQDRRQWGGDQEETDGSMVGGETVSKVKGEKFEVEVEDWGRLDSSAMVEEDFDVSCLHFDLIILNIFL